MVSRCPSRYHGGLRHLFVIRFFCARFKMLKQVAGVHHAAFFGLEGTIALLRKRHGPDRKDTLGQTPLWLAAQKGYKAVFDDLLSLKDAVNLDSRDESS